MTCKSAAIVPFAPGIGNPSRSFSVTSNARLSAAFAVSSRSFFPIDAYEGGLAASAVNLADQLNGVGVRVQDYQNWHQIAGGLWEIENVCLNDK